jgi:chromosome partitioning protein
MRRLALINQKGGVGKTTTAVNLGAALAITGKRVVLVDLDPQANLTLHLGLSLSPGAATSYRVLTGEVPFAEALRDTRTPNLQVVPTDIDLSGAELELSAAPRREHLLRAAVAAWEAAHRAANGAAPADYILFDCPPSLGLLSLNALVAAQEVLLVVQTHFLALQGLSKLVEIIGIVRRDLNPALELRGIVPCLYDSRMRLAREVLAELRRYFPSLVLGTPIATNVKLAEAPSFGQTIFEYAPESTGARDFLSLARELLAQERPPAAKEAPALEAEAEPVRAIAPMPPAPPLPLPQEKKARRAAPP